MHNCLMTPFKIVIPARYASTRLPGKPLQKLNGKPLIEHVYLAASKSEATEIIVATDNKDIFDTVVAFGGYAVMTRENHPSGTDRINEVATIQNWDPSTIVVNLQGDEPLVKTENIHSLVTLLSNNNSADMATLATPIKSITDVVNPNNVKVVIDNNNFALYFSRAPIPWVRDSFNSDFLNSSNVSLPDAPFYSHIGLYAYRVKTLQQFSVLEPSPLELAESLEQLRIISNGMKIIVKITTDSVAYGVDTPADLIAVEKILKKQSKNKP